MGLLEKVKSLLGGSNDIMGQHIQLNVCMMGPRGVGKTTVLTSIFHDSDKMLNKDGLYFSACGETRDKIEDGYQQLCDIFREIPDEQATPLPGINATKGISEFKFRLGLKGDGARKDKRTSVNVTITDFPGEFVDENHTEYAKAQEFIKKSELIILAIDAVHLMEEEGKYNEVRNKSVYMCKKISTMLKLLGSTERKVILFVPLKSEKYFIQKRMTELTDKVCKAYKPLIDDVRANYGGQIGLFVTPIQTLGGVTFNQFGKGADGNVALNMDGCPSDVKYKFFRIFSDKKPMYMPAYCVQPLYYLVAFALSQYKANQKSGGILGTMFKGVFSLFSSDLEFYQACQNFVSKIKTDGDGYVTLNNPKIINTNF